MHAHAEGTDTLVSPMLRHGATPRCMAQPTQKRPRRSGGEWLKRAMGTARISSASTPTLRAVSSRGQSRRYRMRGGSLTQPGSTMACGWQRSWELALRGWRRSCKTKLSDNASVSGLCRRERANSARERPRGRDPQRKALESQRESCMRTRNRGWMSGWMLCSALHRGERCVMCAAGGVLRRSVRSHQPRSPTHAQLVDACRTQLMRDDRAQYSTSCKPIGQHHRGRRVQ